jgi:hypothetical protein
MLDDPDRGDQHGEACDDPVQQPALGTRYVDGDEQLRHEAGKQPDEHGSSRERVAKDGPDDRYRYAWYRSDSPLLHYRSPTAVVAIRKLTTSTRQGRRSSGHLDHISTGRGALRSWCSIIGSARMCSAIHTKPQPTDRGSSQRFSSATYWIFAASPELHDHRLTASAAPRLATAQPARKMTNW